MSGPFEPQADPQSSFAVTGPKALAAGHYALVEELDPPGRPLPPLDGELIRIGRTPGLTLLLATADPGSPTEAALHRLAAGADRRRHR
jgi:hypothetical protein